ncbi:MAG: TonB-dependent receptor [Desulfobacterales bacterium]|nr:TonB-dependent receptor [Desulfobacterales bacterium]
MYKINIVKLVTVCLKQIYSFIILIPFVFISSFVQANDGNLFLDETMLMFVGEDLPVVTLASRMPESPASAPAIVSVVDRTMIDTFGYDTLAKLLATEPGFYMLQRSRGTVPFLRGIPDSVLFLYDGVPIAMDVTKHLLPLDHEFSMNSVKRVEIVRGPGSVLWGADAFAGVVNVVPFSGKDRSGVEVKLISDMDDMLGSYASYGKADNKWDTFISVSAMKDRYYDDTFLVAKDIGSKSDLPLETGRLKPSSYLEITGNAHWDNWLTVSGRFSDFKRRYTMSDTTFLSWAGERESPMSYLKASMTKIWGASHWTLTSYYQNIEYKVTDVDLKRSQRNNLYYSELLWDRRILQKGMMTAGFSYRANYVKGAIVEDHFLPASLKPSNTFYVPKIEQADYDNNLKSLFAQYRHKLRMVECWIGGRIDDNSQYNSTASYNFGFNYPFLENWRFKSAFGTAYRSPYAGQFFDRNKQRNSDAISTINAQLSWYPVEVTEISLTTFYSTLSDHVQEDPYGGISMPTDHEFIGTEINAKTSIQKLLDIYARLTAIHSWGEKAKYTILKYVYIRPDGTNEAYYDNWDQPVNGGPGIMGGLGCTWHLHSKLDASLDANMAESIPYTFAKDTVAGRFKQPILINLTIKWRDILVKNNQITLQVDNLLDERYHISGIYGPEKSEPITLYVDWSFRY